MPPFGLFAPLPLRLGGSATEGWSALQHARLAADLVAMKRTAPLAVMTFTKAGSVVTINAYFGQNGSGLGYAPDVVTPGATGVTTFQWSNKNFQDPYKITHPIHPQGGYAIVHSSGPASAVLSLAANAFTVRSFTFGTFGGSAADGKVTVVLS